MSLSIGINICRWQIVNVLLLIPDDDIMITILCRCIHFNIAVFVCFFKALITSQVNNDTNFLHSYMYFIISLITYPYLLSIFIVLL